MSTTPPETGPSQTGPPLDTHGPRVTGEQIRDVSRLRRSLVDRKISGVCGGLGRHLDVDPVLFRVAFCVLALFGGGGLILYVVLWLIVPDEGAGRSAIDLDDRSRAITIIVVAALAAATILGMAWGDSWLPWPLVILGLIALLIMSNRGRPATPVNPTPPPPGPPADGLSTADSVQYGTFPTAPVAQPAGYPWAYPGRPVASATATMPYPAPPVDPRRRGPLLFWPTCALIALGVGLLGMADVAGLDVSAAAYPALAVALIASMLIVGAWWGRAGGLIALGLAGLMVLAITSVTDHTVGRSVSHRPTTAAGLADGYTPPPGEFTLDLTAFDRSDLVRLPDRTVAVDQPAGRITVVVPPDLPVTVTAHVGLGTVSVLGTTRGGTDVGLTRSGFTDPGEPRLTLDLHQGAGEIIVTQEPRSIP